jgi:DNA mismatch endonuclease (patch repair protein)
MTDVFTKAKRSEVMARIRGRGNKATELALAALLRAYGITGWRRHQEIRGRARSPQHATGGARLPVSRLARTLAPPKNGVPGVPRPAFRVKPDFVFRKLRTVIFVDGCFWHGCPRHATKPKNNREFWRKKLAGNKTRDQLVTRTLRRAGWRVVRIWEHELRKNREGFLRRRILQAVAFRGPTAGRYSAGGSLKLVSASRKASVDSAP